jgi:hypothetical protein
MSRQLAANPLATRDDVARALAALAAPVLRSLADPGPAGLAAVNVSRHSDACSRIESLARPLWGIAPFAAGGGRLEGVEALAHAIARGFDPGDPLYWGEPRDHDPRIPELAAVAFAIRVAPAAFLDPLAPAARANIRAWIERMATRAVPDNNWLGLRAMGLLAAERLGGGLDVAAIAAALDRIERFDAGGGWYSDGPNEQRDHYVAFALHFDALLYAAFEDGRDAVRAARLRERAARFAHDYATWFDADGGALPIGRSLGYRFAQGAFWGALAFAGVQALPWGEVKGLWLRNLRWWLRRPILDAAGWLAPGYAYPNASAGEDYMSPGSPYWAFKAFLPLALPATHPFWAARESGPPALPAVAPQPAARLLACRAESGRHVYALCAGQWAAWRPRHDAARYAKLCYSTRFGFSVAAAATGLEAGAFDSTLAFTDDGVHFRVRRATSAHEIGERHVASSWEPWPDVAVRTWLVAAPPWHLRLHRIRSARALSTVEGGFAIPCEGADRLDARAWVGEAGRARASGEHGACEIVDLAGKRNGLVVLAEPGTNLMAPRTAIPTLGGPIDPGETWLACAVAASVGGPEGPMPFRLAAGAAGWRVETPDWALELR